MCANEFNGTHLNTHFHAAKSDPGTDHSHQNLKQQQQQQLLYIVL